jgi:hypothetical protein
MCHDSVARGYDLKKIQIWVNFEASCNGICLVLSGPFSLFYGQMVYFMAVWYVHFVVIWYRYVYPFWHVVPNLATLVTDVSIYFSLM